jgi:hypothetical protein
MFDFFYGEEVVASNTTQGFIEDFEQGEAVQLFYLCITTGLYHGRKTILPPKYFCTSPPLTKRQYVLLMHPFCLYFPFFCKYFTLLLSVFSS